ncbi:MAG TPA: hypothetical protein VIL46_04230 [Gemmataceae bacterium]
MMTGVDDAFERVTDRESFLRFVEALLADRRADAAGTPDPFGRGPRGWENHSVEEFLGAALAWAEDAGRSGRGLPEAPTWQAFAEFLFAGKVYE